MITGILRLLDVALGIKEYVPRGPPDPPAKISPDRLDRLKDLYLELGSEMRALRSTEFATAGIFFAVATALLGGNIAALASDKLTSAVKFVAAFSSAAFLVLFWVHVHGRIAHDHSSYDHLMNRRRWIEQQWFWLGMPGKPENIGSGVSGPGYRKTQWLIATTALSVVTLLVTLLLISEVPKLFCTACLSPQQSRQQCAESAVKQEKKKVELQTTGPSEGKSQSSVAVLPAPHSAPVPAASGK